MAGLKPLEQYLGYQFSQPSLLQTALTHSSAGSDNNERLEFLGDAMLGAIIAKALYDQFPQAREGELTRMRARLVRGETLAELAHEIDLEAHLVLGAGELRTGGRKRTSIRADALEAVFGAIYLDSNFDRLRDVVLALYAQRLKTVEPSIDKDPKTQLQELLQQRGLNLPKYSIVAESGQAHNLDFEVQCELREPAYTFTAVGKSRRIAEQMAAQQALAALNKQDEINKS